MVPSGSGNPVHFPFEFLVFEQSLFVSDLQASPGVLDLSAVRLLRLIVALCRSAVDLGHRVGDGQRCSILELD